ncbi:ubiquitin-like-conjugating enzyme ATG10 isoform X3 [Carassius gibelio]|uniref:ubiquitin-like-conjugating enzyme ATG10 isoform X3 n=1 Tax=Carassius gibelio TaxID=101364 RepID=UPI002277EA19|nr:ubiquitin-like-conjugating enzyme ATG10 isoform X3 [Carassius gibelio]
MHLGIFKITYNRTATHFMDDCFVNLGEEVILTLLQNSVTSESANMAGERNPASCYLDERTFRLCCQLFLQHSETIQDGWSWEQIKGTDEGFMKKTVIMPVKPSVLHKQHEYSIQDENMVTDDIQANVEDETAGVQAVCEIHAVLRYEYHVLYSCSYQIPVLYFRASTLDGRPLSLEEVWSNVHPNYRQRLQQGPWDTLTQQGPMIFVMRKTRTELQNLVKNGIYCITRNVKK